MERTGQLAIAVTNTTLCYHLLVPITISHVRKLEIVGGQYVCLFLVFFAYYRELHAQLFRHATNDTMPPHDARVFRRS
jgi:hypothetical protein